MLSLYFIKLVFLSLWKLYFDIGRPVIWKKKVSDFKIRFHSAASSSTEINN